MKYRILIAASLALLTLPALIDPPGSLIGRWQSKAPGVTVINIFRADSTFDVTVNGKLFVNGKYKVSADTFAVSDPICGPGYYGRYKLSFFAPDSVSYAVIEDTCRGRRSSMDKGKIGRVRPGQTK